MKRLTLILTLTVSLMLIVAALPVAAQDGGDDHGEGDTSETMLRGAAVYATYCQACHGPTGEAIGTGPAFAAIEYDHDTARATISEGIEADAAAMPGYVDVLESAELDDLIAYMDTWETHTTPPLPHPNLHDVPAHVQDYFGDPHEGAVVYASFCAGCHGAEGEGRDAFDSPAIELTATTTEIVAEEHTPAFGEDSGGPLSEEQLTNLETYMASWADHETQPEDSGINIMIVVMGAAAILTVGGVYLLRSKEEPADD